MFKSPIVKTALTILVVIAVAKVLKPYVPAVIAQYLP